MKLKSYKIGKQHGFKYSDFGGIIFKMGLVDTLIDKSLEEAIQEYLIDLQVGNRTTKTLEFYKQRLMGFQKDNRTLTVNQVTAQHIKEYLYKKLGHPYTMHGTYRALRAFFNWAIKNKLITVNPITSLPAPKLPQRIIPTLNAEDVKKLLAICNSKHFTGRRNRAIILILLDTGIRLTELANLTLRDINIEQGLLRIWGKGNKERIVRISGSTRKALWEYIKFRASNRIELWLSEEKRPLLAKGIYLALHRLSKETGVKCNPHTFRHTFAIEYLRAGGDIFTLKTILGHQSLEIVSRYLRSLSTEDAIRAHMEFSPVERMI